MKIRLSLMLAFALLMFAAGLHADEVVYNTLTTPASTSDGWISGSGLFGTPFSPSATVDLTSLTGEWFESTEAITVSLWSSGTGGQPDTELESWTPTISHDPADYTLVSTSSPLLTAGQTYWVEAEAPVDPILGFRFMFWGVDVTTPTGGVWIGDSPADWSDAFPDAGAAALEVQGTPQGTATVTPEPGTAILFLTGIVLMILTRKRIAQTLRLDAGTRRSLSPH